MAKKVKAAKMAYKSGTDEERRVRKPVVIGWAWERGIKVGCGRKPDAFLFTEEEVKMFDPEDFIVIRANSQWVGSAGSSPVRR